VASVAMESTGVYWIRLYEVLEEAGLQFHFDMGKELYRVPGTDLTVVPGCTRPRFPARPPTSTGDCSLGAVDSPMAS
jgi:hypothetical protein